MAGIFFNQDLTIDTIYVQIGEVNCHYLLVNNFSIRTLYTVTTDKRSQKQYYKNVWDLFHIYIFIILNQKTPHS